MIRIRPYMDSDQETVLSWCDGEDTFLKWTFGVLGEYPVTAEKFRKTGEYMRFTAIDEEGPAGFFIARNPGGNPDELRFGFAIVCPGKRDMGIGKEMIKQGLIYAFRIYGADRVTLGVYEENHNAASCYRSAGFHETGKWETYTVGGKEYQVFEMESLKKETD